MQGGQHCLANQLWQNDMKNTKFRMLFTLLSRAIRLWGSSMRKRFIYIDDMTLQQAWEKY